MDWLEVGGLGFGDWWAFGVRVCWEVRGRGGSFRAKTEIVIGLIDDSDTPCED